MIRKRVVVSGLVQGVFFRDTCCREARALDVSGWVRNLADGTVEAVFQGGEDEVESMVRWAHRGPRGAQVNGVSVVEEAAAPLHGFEVR
jgi:acylphosphatase